MVPTAARQSASSRSPRRSCQASGVYLSIACWGQQALTYRVSSTVSSRVIVDLLGVACACAFHRAVEEFVGFVLPTAIAGMRLLFGCAAHPVAPSGFPVEFAGVAAGFSVPVVGEALGFGASVYVRDVLPCPRDHGGGDLEVVGQASAAFSRGGSARRARGVFIFLSSLIGVGRVRGRVT